MSRKPTRYIYNNFDWVDNVTRVQKHGKDPINRSRDTLEVDITNRKLYITSFFDISNCPCNGLGPFTPTTSVPSTVQNT